MFKPNACMFLLACVLPGLTIADQVFVSLEKDNAIAVFDGVSGKPTKLIGIGNHPRGIVLSKDQKQLYVAVSDDNVIKRIDVATLTVTGAYLCKNPKTFALSPDNRFLYSSNDADNSLTVIDISQNQTKKLLSIAKEPEGISVSPDGKWIVSTSEAENVAQWINAGALNIKAATPVATRPRSSQFTADGKQLWVSSEAAAALTIIDVDSKRPIKTLKFKIPGMAVDSIMPVGIRIDKQQRFAYVALGRANHIAVIDAQKLEVINFVAVGQRVWNLEFSPDQKRLYTTNGLSGDVSIIDLENHKLQQSVTVGAFPWGVAVAP
ncbi:MAG: PQQ-dependent catabolism-associated beta-propeller protein [Methylomonas lenta]|nr:PQQ-dependent catabolism-associated beta-propeller protein [Methylomonas lenta]